MTSRTRPQPLQPVPQVTAALAAGNARSLPRDELEPLMVELVGSWRVGKGWPDLVRRNEATRPVRRVLDWLEASPGQDWQQRWATSGAESGDWMDLAGITGRIVRVESLYAMSALLVLRVVQPSNDWMVQTKRQRLWEDFTVYHDSAIYQRIREMTAKASYSVTTRMVTSQLVQLSIVTGKGLSELTAEDYLTFQQWLRDSPHTNLNLHATWHYVRLVGLLPGQPDELAQLLATRRLTPTEMVDRYEVGVPEMRALFIDYLTERQACGSDYATLTTAAMHLVNHFWGDIRAHHPDQASLVLTPAQAAAWRDRLRTLDNGAQRKDWGHVVQRVRSFYLDLSAWAHEDPARWGPWVAPCPVTARAAKVAGVRSRHRQIAEMQQRTRTLAPFLPQLAASMKSALRQAETLLTACSQVEPGQQFSVDGQEWTRKPLSSTYVPCTVSAVDPAGKVVDLSGLEDRAFWGWAALETLRNTGIRCQELLSLTHLSIRPFRKPSGEVIPLLQIAPSKTDVERVLPASPELAHVLGRVVARSLAAGGGAVPVITRHNSTQKVFSVPMPYLFQRTYGSGRRHVICPSSIVKYFNDAALRADLRDNDGTRLRFSPHDFRRLFATDLNLYGVPIHIAAQILGHASLDTTRGYTAIYPVEVFKHYDQFLSRRRAERPADEYRTPTPEELTAFAEHFGRRRVELGDCVRPYGTGCTHEHACIRCDFLQTHPDADARLQAIETDLHTRIETAQQQNWLGDLEQLRLTLTRLREKRDEIGQRRGAPGEVLAAQPVAQMPPQVVAAAHSNAAVEAGSS